MRIKTLYITALIMLPLKLNAQVDIVCDNDVVAHDVDVSQEMPDALREMIGKRHYSKIRQKAANKIYQRSTRKSIARSKVKAVNVGPLLKSIRAQEEPYNLLCPYYTYDNGKVSPTPCLSGCVAASIEQIIAYYKYPKELKDTIFGWSTDHYTIEDLLPGTQFDWDNYLDDYRNGWTEPQGKAIALTTLAVGMAVKMRYSPNSSGAYTANIVEPLKNAFGYGMVRWADRVLYTPEKWHAMLQHELKNGRPIAYVGHNMEMSGHAFDIDGIDSDGYYHINWGYGGYYDGWYDLDWLNPWETTDLITNGIAYGFFSNQGALFMHPSSEAKTLELDSLDIENLGIEVTGHKYLRTPEDKGYTAIDLTFANNSQNDVTYTYEIFTYLPTDTDVFMQADYIGISALTIPAGQTKTQRAYTMFHESGERILGISHDDVTICYSSPVTISKGKTAKVRWENPKYQITTDENTHAISADFSIEVTNESSDAYGSDIIFYCLYPEGPVVVDERHFDVLDLPPSEYKTLKVHFSDLEPNTHYHFLFRCPWAVRASLEFDTPNPTAVTTPSLLQNSNQSYNITGMPWHKNDRGIMIKSGKKWLNK